MHIELDGESRWMELAVACVRAMGNETTTASTRRPQVLISHPGPWRAPKGFPSRRLVSVGSNWSHNFRVDAERLLDWLLANGLVSAKKLSEVEHPCEEQSDD